MQIKSLEHDECWWCHAEQRQTVHHLFKEYHRWRKERESLRRKLGPAVWDHRGIEHIFVDRRKTPFILKFLENTEIGNRTSQSEADKKAEEWNEVWGWSYGDESDAEDEPGIERRAPTLYLGNRRLRPIRKRRNGMKYGDGATGMNQTRRTNQESREGHRHSISATEDSSSHKRVRASDSTTTTTPIRKRSFNSETDLARKWVKQQPANPKHIHFPAEIMLRILDFCSDGTLLNFARTSKAYNAIIQPRMIKRALETPYNEDFGAKYPRLDFHERRCPLICAIFNKTESLLKVLVDKKYFPVDGVFP
jgi:hypothetical protein